MGSGYNIPVSLSDASGFTTPFAFEAPNIILFPGATLSGGYHGGISQNTETPVTATSSAAEGGSSSNRTQGPNAGIGDGGGLFGGGSGGSPSGGFSLFGMDFQTLAILGLLGFLVFKVTKGK